MTLKQVNFFYTVFQLWKVNSNPNTLYLQWYYNQHQHWKGPINVVAGTTKNAVFCDIKSVNCMINTPQKFANYADDKLIRFTTLYMLKEDRWRTDGEPFYKRYYRRNGGSTICSHGEKDLMKSFWKKFWSGFNVLCAQCGSMNQDFMTRFKACKKLKYVQFTKMIVFVCSAF